MKKKYYTVFFASDRNQYSRSIQISKNGIIFLSLFGIIIVGLAVLGGLRLVNREPLSREISALRKDYLLLNNIIADLNYSMELDSTINYEHFVSKFYSLHDLGYPDKAPVDGYVTRGLQLGNNHLGIDIAAKHRDEVHAPAHGRVVYSGESDILGKTIIINHSGGFITIFGHNDSILVQAGEEIKKHQIIAYVGETGISQGPHLHYEIWKNNQVLDPREIVPEYKKKDVSISETRK